MSTQKMTIASQDTVRSGLNKLYTQLLQAHTYTPMAIKRRTSYQIAAAASLHTHLKFKCDHFYSLAT
jgi:hypothetical protein